MKQQVKVKLMITSYYGQNFLVIKAFSRNDKPHRFNGAAYIKYSNCQCCNDVREWWLNGKWIRSNIPDDDFCLTV